MWKCLNSGFKAVLSHFTLSGTHSSNLFDFCDGCHEVYYLRTHFESKQDLVATVVEDLPEEVFMKSSNKPSSTISSLSKHKPDKKSMIVEALSKRQTSHMEVELSKQKLALMQHQEECMEKDEEHLQKEVEQNAAENFFLVMQQSTFSSSTRSFARLQNISLSRRKKRARQDNISLKNGCISKFILEN